MKDESRGGRRWVAMMLVSLCAALGALGISNLSCGAVTQTACAQEACPGIEVLERRVMELEQKLQPLLTIEQKLQPLLALAQLQCVAGSVLAWSGSTWECTKTIAGDLTIAGKATIGDELTVSSATVNFGTTPMRYSRASIGRLGSKIQYSVDGTLVQELDIGDGTQPLGGGLNGHIQYTPGGISDAFVLFNINELRSFNCTLLHSEDDAVAYDLAFATDSGNGFLSTWGGAEKPTFVVSRRGVATHVLADSSNYDIVCF